MEESTMNEVEYVADIKNPEKKNQRFNTATCNRNQKNGRRF